MRAGRPPSTGGVIDHPLLGALLAAADGAFPPVDGRAVLVPALPGGMEAVVSFTGHVVLATELTHDDLADLDLDGFGAALHPAVLLRVAGAHGVVGVVDATLVGRGLGGGDMPARTDLGDHPRVRHAASLRQKRRMTTPSGPSRTRTALAGDRRRRARWTRPRSSSTNHAGAMTPG